MNNYEKLMSEINPTTSDEVFARAVVKKAWNNEYRANSVAMQFIPVMIALVILVGGVTATGVCLRAGNILTDPASAFTELDESAKNLMVIYADDGTYVGSIPQPPEDASLETLRFNAAEKGIEYLYISVYNDIIVLKSVDIPDIEISYYNNYNGYEFTYNNFCEPDKNALSFNKMGCTNECASSVVYVTVPKDVRLKQVNLSTNSNVLAEDFNVAYLSLQTNRKDKNVVNLLNCDIDGVSVNAAADVYAKGCRFNGTDSNVAGRIGFYFRQNDFFNSTENQHHVRFENCETTGLWLEGSISCDVKNSIIGQFVQYKVTGEHANLTGCDITELHVQGTGNNLTVYGGKINYVAIQELVNEKELVVSGNNYTVNNFKITNCEVGSYAVVYQPGENGWFNIITGKEQEYAIPIGATFFTS